MPPLPFAMVVLLESSSTAILPFFSSKIPLILNKSKMAVCCSYTVTVLSLLWLASQISSHLAVFFFLMNKCQYTMVSVLFFVDVVFISFCHFLPSDEEEKRNPRLGWKWNILTISESWVTVSMVVVVRFR